MHKDIFICHASEDKTSVVRPLASSLLERGFSCWIDEAEISVGESITEKVNEGIKISEYVVVVLSRAFMAKNWPKREFWAVLNLEAKSDRVIILPILVGSPTEVDEIVNEFPLLNDKLFLFWKGDANRVANALQTTILKVRSAPQKPEVEMHKCGQCATPFELGVHVCLGCQGKIIYGLTAHERLNIRKKTATGIGLVAMVTMLYLPSYSESWFGFRLPMMWGIGVWAFPIALVITLVCAFYMEARIARSRSHLVRTFR